LGQRRSEVANMRWSAVDLDAGTWALNADEVKSSRAHLVPLPPLAVTLLRGLPRLSYLDANGDSVTSDWVLTTNARAPISDFSKPKRLLDAAMARALESDPPHWVVHDIRRTVSTNLARLGVDPFIRRRVLNHALTGVDAIYDRFDYLPAKRSALVLWAADLQRLTGLDESDDAC
jgi:integrase